MSNNEGTTVRSLAIHHPAGAAARGFLAKPLHMLIGGRWVDARSGARRVVRDPATTDIVATVPDGDAQDIDAAVTAARRAFERWSTGRPVERQKVLLALADLMETHAEELAELEAIDSGKLLNVTRHGDLVLAVETVRYMAGWATKIEGHTITPSFSYLPDARFESRTLIEPVGVVGQIIPWNFPLVMAVMKIAPALAAGCTVVLKPAEDTPLSALRLGELACAAGLPEGVLNIVTGAESAGQALVDHPDVDKISFTGSTEVGRHIQARAATTLKRVSLELGGKSPVVIFRDVDIESAIRGAAQAIFFNQGQVCTAGSRLFVERPIYDEVVAGLGKVADALKVGSGFDPASEIGPLISSKHHARVRSYIERGLAEGARIVGAGGSVPACGYYQAPTVFADAARGMSIYREEIFGPVVAAVPFEGEEEAILLANDTVFGLAASVWTQQLSLAHRVSRRIRSGTVWLNCHNLLDAAVPFGGMKMSGVGREFGRAAIDLYVETKAITMML